MDNLYGIICENEKYVIDLIKQLREQNDALFKRVEALEVLTNELVERLKN